MVLDANKRIVVAFYWTYFYIW